MSWVTSGSHGYDVNCWKYVTLSGLRHCGYLLLLMFSIPIYQWKMCYLREAEVVKNGCRWSLSTVILIRQSSLRGEKAFRQRTRSSGCIESCLQWWIPTCQFLGFVSVTEFQIQTVSPCWAHLCHATSPALMVGLAWPLWCLHCSFTPPPVCLVWVTDLLGCKTGGQLPGTAWGACSGTHAITPCSAISCCGQVVLAS